MNNRIKNAVAEYQRKYEGQNGAEGKFYTADFYEVLELAQTDARGSNADLLICAVFNALEAGYMIGYRKAKRDSRKTRTDADSKLLTLFHRALPEHQQAIRSVLSLYEKPNAEITTIDEIKASKRKAEDNAH